MGGERWWERRRGGESAFGAGEECFEVRGLILAIDDTDFDAGEAGFFEPQVHVAFGEAEPAVTVEIAGLFELVLGEIEDHELAAGFEDLEGAGEGLRGIGGVVKGLTEDDEIDGLGGDGGVLEIADSKLEVLEAVFAGLFGAELNHLLGIIDGNDPFAAAGEQFGEKPFAGAEVSDGKWREDAEEQVAKGLPGASGAVTAVEAAGDLIEVQLSLFLAAFENPLEVDLIGLVLGELARALDGEGSDVERVGRAVGVQAVERAFAIAPGGDEASFCEEAEVGADAGLAESGDFLEFVDGQLFVFEEGDDPKAGRVGQSSEGFQRGGHAGS